MAMKYAEELNIKPIISQNLVFTDEEVLYEILQ
jgi:hypothetical protein